MVRLGDLVLPVTSRAPAETDAAFRYVDLSTVDASTKSLTEPKLLDWSDAPSRARQRLAGGDVLVATVRPNLNGVAVVPHDLEGAIGSTGFCVLRADPAQLDNRYLFHWVRSTPFVAAMTRLATGASYPAVSDATVKSSEIPLPPLLEQRRIASMLDAVSRLRAQRRAAIGALEQSVSRLFEEALASSRTRESIPLGALTSKITDGTHQAPVWAPKGVPFLFVSNVVSGKINYKTTKFVSEETYSELTKSTAIEVGDLLYTAVGSYGVPALVEDGRPFIFQRHIALIKPLRDRVHPAFLRGALGSTYVRRQADRVARGVAQKTVTLGDLAKFEIPLIDESSQVRYVTRVQAAEELLALHAAHLAKLDELFASLQHRAFRGEL